MIKIDQVKLLDDKISRIVEVVQYLKEENKNLRSQIENYKERVQTLETELYDLYESQGAIEDLINHSLSELNKVDDMTIENLERENTYSSDKSGSPQKNA